MPLHPVSIVLGTTLVVIGSGYAFKKFIYDPHLAPYIEALLASHSATFHNDPHPVPIAVSSSRTAADLRVDASAGISSARKDPYVALRRRSGRRSPKDAQDLRGTLVQSEYELREGTSHPNPCGLDDDIDDWGRPSTYELADTVIISPRKGSAQTDPLSAPSTRRPSKTVDPSFTQASEGPHKKSNHPLIDLDFAQRESSNNVFHQNEHFAPALSEQDAEVRQVIFNYAPSTILSRSTSGPEAVTEPFVTPNDSDHFTHLALDTNPFARGVPPDLHARPSKVPVTLTLPGQAASPGRPAASTRERMEAACMSDGSAQGDDNWQGSPRFSFLSLSQVSSPEMPTVMLGSWSLGQAVQSSPLAHSQSVTQEDSVPVATHLEDKIMSLPEITTSGYEDDDSYSLASGDWSPPPIASFPHPRQDPVTHDVSTGGKRSTHTEGTQAQDGAGPFVASEIESPSGLGLAWVHTGRPEFTRGPLSVVSLSESEGWRSDDFDGVEGN